MNRRNKRRFRKSEQVTAAEQYRRQREMVLSRYRRAVELTANGQEPPFNLEIVLGFSGKSQADFVADVEEAKRVMALPPYLRPNGGTQSIL